LTKASNVVLVHGLYADASCWIDVIPYLQNAGLNVTAVQNPLTSLADAAAATRRILALQKGPTVLVGHSFAGTIISETGNDPNVSALVYVAARAPDAGEDFAALAAKFPKPPASAGVVHADGFFWLSEEAFLKDFAGEIKNGHLRWITDINRLVIVAQRETENAIDQVGYITKAARLATIAKHRQGFMVKRLTDKCWYDSAIFQTHPWPISIKDPDNFSIHSMIAVVGHRYRFGESFSLIVHPTGADRINVAPIILALRMDQRITIAFRGRS